MLSKIEKLEKDLKTAKAALMQIEDSWNQFRNLHQLFKHVALELLTEIPPHSDAIQNLDTLLALFFQNGDPFLTEIENLIRDTRKVLRSDRQ